MRAHEPCQHVEPVGIDATHRAHIGAEMPPFDEARQRQLRDGCAVPVQQGPRHRHGRHELGRQDHVTDAQARKQRLGEGADVDRPIVRVEPLHAGRGLARVVELAVVVVLDDPGLVLPRPFDHREPPIQRQRRAGRELMRGRQEDRPGRARRIVQARHLHALVVERHGDTRQPGGIERLAGTVVDGVFDEDPVARVEQYGCAQGQRLLRAGQHQHTLGRGARPPLKIDVVRDGASQRLHALGWAVSQGLGAIVLQHLAFQALPGSQRKAARLRHPGGERPWRNKVAHTAALKDRCTTLTQTHRLALGPGAPRGAAP